MSRPSNIHWIVAAIGRVLAADAGHEARARAFAAEIADEDGRAAMVEEVESILR